MDIALLLSTIFFLVACYLNPNIFVIISLVSIAFSLFDFFSKRNH